MARLRGTIRFRITMLAAAAVALMLTLTAGGLVMAQRRVLTASLDSTLVLRADDLAALLSAAASPPPELAKGVGAPEDFAQLVTDDGRVIASSPNLAGASRIPRLDPGGRTQAIRTRTGLPHDNDVFRVLSRRIATPVGPAVLHLGASLDEVTESTHVLGTSLAVSVPLVAALMAGLVWWLVGRTLAPVEIIRHEVAEIGRSTALHRRVPEPTGDDEISRLAHTMNEMLGRIEDSLELQRRFVADASHELRSPLTRIRTELEVDLARTETSDLRATHQSVLEEVVGLQMLVGDLLFLARADAVAGDVRAEAVDLDDLVLREVGRLKEGGRVEVDMSAVSAAQVLGDAQQLTRAIRNLVDNAERHASGRISIALGEVDGSAVLSVTDDGPGIPADQRQRVFERFGRLDDARSQTAGGTGLGLAITRDIIERHGGTITVDAGDRMGARFTIRLPGAS
ncbi:MAG: sensor histidine kinase [Actinomycetota bacterium]